MIFRSTDGTLLSSESYHAKKTRGSLLVIHGMGEHSGRYAELKNIALKLGLDVHLLDLRGHGRSQGIRGHFSSMDLLHQDLDSWLSHLVDGKKLPAHLPCFLLGHSLGGLVAITYAPKFPRKPLYPELSGLCLSSPALGLTPLRVLQHQLAKKVPLALQNLQIPSGISPEHLTHDPEVVAAYQEDSLVHSWITPAAFLAMNEAIRSLRSVVPHLGMPMLFLISGRDKVVDPVATETFCRKLKVAHPGRVDVRVFHTFFHEPFHELKKERAFTEFKKWILKCLPKTPKSSAKSSAREATGKVSLH